MRHLGLIWEALRTSLWFVPSLFVLGAIVLAQGMIELDHVLPMGKLESALPRVFAVGPSGARSVLATVAGSMISVAGVAFSITIVALTLASSQYTSRILRNFMRDRANQAVLGAFVGIFVYCLWVLRTISEGSGEAYSFVPATAVLMGVVLAIVGIACLIFFIHHIAQAIQAEHIILAATNETLDTVDRLFPERLGKDADAGEETAAMARVSDGAMAWRAIASNKTGYLQSVDEDGLLRFACERGIVVRMECAIGRFVVEGSALASLAVPPAPASVADTRQPEGHTVEALRGLFAIGGQRTTVQDSAYGIRQIVDVALKALSPGVNDTTTAVSCVEHLTSIMARVAVRRIPSAYRLEEGQVRVIALRPSFAELLGNAFDQIRQNSAGNVATLQALVDGLIVLADRAAKPEYRQSITDQLDLIAALAERTIEQDADRARIEETVRRLREDLGEAG
ncbi:MAG: DUF2254 domain-containing protein [Phycisphaera sp.]|nr:MAG: DUF2254 domain-containing protein [Phycisphaera sp.]